MTNQKKYLLTHFWTRSKSAVLREEFDSWLRQLYFAIILLTCKNQRKHFGFTLPSLKRRLVFCVKNLTKIWPPSPARTGQSGGFLLPALTRRGKTMKSVKIFPLKKPIEAEVTIPGSKSYTNRALLLGAINSFRN